MKLFDTDTLSLFHRGHANVTAHVDACDELIATTVFTRCEILQARIEFLFKAADGDQLRRAQSWLDQSEQDLMRTPIISVDTKAAEEFERLRHDKSLRKIGRVDLLIASVALAHRATVVTRNVKHFRQVPGLKVENWVDD